jgi:sugar-specific transcriptional regulator TrmB
MKELIDNLQYLNIPRREGEVYLALLQKKEFTAPEISKITSVSRTKSYEILQNLVKKGLCNESYRNGIKVFSCIDPKIVIENILSDYEKKKRVADELKVSLNELFKKNGKDESPLDYIEVLTDREQIKEKWLTIQRNTKKELLVFSKTPYAFNLNDNVDKETDVIKNKVIVRGIYEFKDLAPEEITNLIKMIEVYQKIGEDSRIIKELPMKLVISDETISMFALNDRISLKPTITSMVVDHRSFAKAQKEIFESYWTKGISIEDFKRDQNKYFNSK